MMIYMSYITMYDVLDTLDASNGVMISMMSA